VSASCRSRWAAAGGPPLCLASKLLTSCSMRQPGTAPWGGTHWGAEPAGHLHHLAGWWLPACRLPRRLQLRRPSPSRQPRSKLQRTRPLQRRQQQRRRPQTRPLRPRRQLRQRQAQHPPPRQLLLHPQLPCPAMCRLMWPLPASGLRHTRPARRLLVGPPAASQRPMAPQQTAQRHLLTSPPMLLMPGRPAAGRVVGGGWVRTRGGGCGGGGHAGGSHRYQCLCCEGLR